MWSEQKWLQLVPILKLIALYNLPCPFPYCLLYLFGWYRNLQLIHKVYPWGIMVTVLCRCGRWIVCCIVRERRRIWCMLYTVGYAVCSVLYTLYGDSGPSTVPCAVCMLSLRGSSSLILLSCFRCATLAISGLERGSGGPCPGTADWGCGGRLDAR